MTQQINMQIQQILLNGGCAQYFRPYSNHSCKHTIAAKQHGIRILLTGDMAHDLYSRYLATGDFSSRLDASIADVGEVYSLFLHHAKGR